MENRAVTWATEKDKQRDMRRMRIATIKSNIRMGLFIAFWRTLHFTKTARIYSKTMCRFNLYGKFPDGRCMWCGENHEKNI